jgi:hypothetical protein
VSDDDAITSAMEGVEAVMRRLRAQVVEMERDLTVDADLNAELREDWLVLCHKRGCRR